MTIRAFVLAALTVFPTFGSAIAGDRIDFTPPLYREQARSTASVRAASEITTTPSLVRASSDLPRRIVEATAR